MASSYPKDNRSSISLVVAKIVDSKETFTTTMTRSVRDEISLAGTLFAAVDRHRQEQPDGRVPLAVRPD
ncbi:hypothetical protein AERO8C_120235 [Aeromonas veronii]|uniref:Uncharacterized protein n=1 Tax=Aeromonas veronii TaxID=654 RepID=A0A653KSJ0_AERVE|nr:hypothetical protein AERO8C_120235 [Aeromonas veronii]